MKTFDDLTTDEKTMMLRFFEENKEKYNNESLTDIRNINKLYFVYDSYNRLFLSFGKDLNESLSKALKWDCESKTDSEFLLEHLNRQFEFISVKLSFIPTLH